MPRCKHVRAFRSSQSNANKRKGLRCRNSPTCTLSQNGYGENNEAIWLETTLKGASHAMVKVKGYLAMLRCKRARIKKFAKQGK